MENEPNKQESTNEEVIQNYIEKTYGRPADGVWRSALGALGGNYLNELYYYKNEGDVPQWHYITSGFSELFDNDPNAEPSTEPTEDFELTFHVLRKESEEAPGQWPFRTFETFAKSVAESGSTYRAYDYVELDGTLDADVTTETKFTGGIFVPDQKLQPLKLPKKNISFLQFIPVTEQELAVFKKQAELIKTEQDFEAYDKAGKEFVEKLRAATNPSLVTDLQRKSIV